MSSLSHHAAPVTGADAEFLAAMCTWSAAVGAGVYAGTALGRFYGQKASGSCRGAKPEEDIK